MESIGSERELGMGIGIGMEEVEIKGGKMKDEGGKKLLEYMKIILPFRY